jgi:hypothetical protein
MKNFFFYRDDIEKKNGPVDFFKIEAKHEQVIFFGKIKC